MRNQGVTALPPTITEMILSTRRRLEKTICLDTSFNEHAEDLYEKLRLSTKDDESLAFRFAEVLEEMSFAMVEQHIHREEYGTAQSLLDEMIASQPRNIRALLELAKVQTNQRHFALAKQNIDRCLEIAPRSLKACEALAWLYESMQLPDEAQPYWKLARPLGIMKKIPYTGEGKPLKVLVLMSVLPGCLFYDKFITPKYFDVTEISVEGFQQKHSLPEHDILICGVSDADLCSAALERCKEIIALSHGPVVNRPEAIERTGRLDVRENISQVQNIRVPRILRLHRKVLSSSAALTHIHESGISFPFLLRSPGFQNGDHFEMVSRADEFKASLNRLPCDELYVIEYMHTPHSDGTIRKYRILCIDGKLYPIHLAISHHWKIHYTSSAMHEREVFRREEAAFLEDMPTVLGTQILQQIHEVFAILDLEYAGIDFSIDEAGRLVVYEANATMALTEPDPGAMWDYRRAATENACHAAREMIGRRVEKAEPRGK